MILKCNFFFSNQSAIKNLKVGYFVWIHRTSSLCKLNERAVVNNQLLLRGHTLVSEEADKVKEIQHAKEALN